MVMGNWTLLNSISTLCKLQCVKRLMSDHPITCFGTLNALASVLERACKAQCKELEARQFQASTDGITAAQYWLFYLYKALELHPEKSNTDYRVCAAHSF